MQYCYGFQGDITVKRGMNPSEHVRGGARTRMRGRRSANMKEDIQKRT